MGINVVNKEMQEGVKCMVTSQYGWNSESITLVNVILDNRLG